MADQWDDSIKRLVREHPQDFVTWLMEGANFREMVSGELKNRTRRTDILMDVVEAGTEESDDPVDGLIHVEIQSVEDADIEDRMWEYNMMATRTYHKDVASFLILLLPVSTIPVSPKVSRFFRKYENWRFHYVVIPLWKVSAKDLLQTGLIGLLPLIPLTEGGTKEDTLATTAADLYVAKEYELLTLVKMIAGLKMKHHLDQEMLERLFAMYHDIIQESWVYQQIVKEGMQKGIEQGIEKGMQKGMEQGIEKGMQKGMEQGVRQTLLNYVEARFPAMLDLAKEQTSLIKDAEQLQRVTTQLFTLQTSGEVEEYLLSLGDDAGKN
jgi:predicted transposase/invertase (TIGR01784 family)